MASAPAIVPTCPGMGCPISGSRQGGGRRMPAPVSEVLAAWMRPFRGYFTNAVWRHALVLVAGALLAPGRRTVTAALRVMGLEQAPGFAVHHRVLSHARWSSRAVGHRLLLLLVAAFVPTGPVIVGIDDTIERRWGPKIKARGIYRDPVRSSRGHFVKVSGLRWLCVMLLAPVPWADCVWALPFLTVLAPSERYATGRGKRHKKLTDWARQALLLTARWLPGRRLIVVADSSFAAIGLLRDLRQHLCVVSRLRLDAGLDAGLYAPPPPRRPGTRGRPRIKGARLPSLAERLADLAGPRWVVRVESLRVAFPAACGAHRSRQRDRRLAHHGPEIGSPLQYPAPWGGDPLFYDNTSEDFVGVDEMLMDLDETKSSVAVSVEFAVKDAAKLAAAYLAEREEGQSLH